MTSIRQLWIDKIGEDNLNSPLGEGLFPPAIKYIEAGVFPDEYDRWYSINGWDIERMIELEEHEAIDIDELGQYTDRGNGGYGDTIAYKYCNGDLSLEEVLEILE